MSQSLKARFNGNTPEIVQHALDNGVLDTMEVYDVKDVVCMLNFLHEVAPDKHFQMVAQYKTDSFAGPDAFDRLLEKMLAKYYRMESTLQVKDNRIAELEKQVNYYKAGKWQRTRPLVQAVLQYCEEK